MKFIQGPRSLVLLFADGIVEVGKEGEELAFLTWTDPDPLPLKVFSFSTWPLILGICYFD